MSMVSPHVQVKARARGSRKLSSIIIAAVLMLCAVFSVIVASPAQAQGEPLTVSSTSGQQVTGSFPYTHSFNATIQEDGTLSSATHTITNTGNTNHIAITRVVLTRGGKETVLYNVGTENYGVTGEYAKVTWKKGETFTVNVSSLNMDVSAGDQIRFEYGLNSNLAISGSQIQVVGTVENATPEPEPEPDPIPTPDPTPDPTPTPDDPDLPEVDAEPGNLTITLNDRETGAPLNGTFTLTNIDTYETREVTVTNGTAQLNDLAKGNYDLIQTVAQDGYRMGSERYCVTADGTGNVYVNAVTCQAIIDGTAGDVNLGPREFRVDNAAGEGKMTLGDVKYYYNPSRGNPYTTTGPTYGSDREWINPNGAGAMNFTFDVEINETVRPNDYFIVDLKVDGEDQVFVSGNLVKPTEVGFVAYDPDTGKQVAFMTPYEVDEASWLIRSFKVTFSEAVVDLPDHVTVEFDIPVNINRYDLPVSGYYKAGVTIGGEPVLVNSQNLTNGYGTYAANNSLDNYGLYVNFPNPMTNSGAAAKSVINRAAMDGDYEILIYVNPNLNGKTNNTYNLISSNQILLYESTGVYAPFEQIEVYEVSPSILLPQGIAVTQEWLDQNARNVTDSVTISDRGNFYQLKFPTGKNQYIVRATGNLGTDYGSFNPYFAMSNGGYFNEYMSLYQTGGSGSGDTNTLGEVAKVGGVAPFFNTPIPEVEGSVDKEPITTVEELDSFGVTSNADRVFWKINTWNSGAEELNSLVITDTFDAKKLEDFRIEKIETYGTSGLSCVSSQTVGHTYQLAETPTMSVTCGSYPVTDSEDPQVTIIVSAKVKEN